MGENIFQADSTLFRNFLFREILQYIFRLKANKLDD